MTAILPTSTKINPCSPEDATYYDAQLTAEVFKTEDGKYRVVTTHGSRPLHGLSALVEARHDQTGRLLGYWRMVGWRSFATGETVGEVPNKKVSHLVYK